MWHSHPASDVCAILISSELGLSQAETEQRLETFARTAETPTDRANADFFE
jgi:Cation transporter/ATPase, N-terminus